MYCRKCGAEIPDDSAFCPICAAQLLSVKINEQETEENSECKNTSPKVSAPKTAPKGTTTQATSSVDPKPKKHIVWEVVVGALLILLIICSEGFRNLLGIVALFAVPVSLVVLVIQAIRKKPKKKWVIACLIALAVVLVFSNTAARSKDAIVGEWELSFVSFLGNDFVPAEDIDIDMSYIVKKDGTAELIRSGNNPIIHIWTYDKERTELLNDAKGGSQPTYTYSAYSVIAETDDGSITTNFEATVYENTLMITSFADGEEVATLAFDRVK